MRIILLLVLTSLTSMAQENWNAKDVIKLEDADIYLEITDYNSALDLYLPLFEKHGSTEEMEYKIGLCYKGLDQMEEAKNYFVIAKDNEIIDAYYELAIYHHQKEEFPVSIALLQAYNHFEEKKTYDKYEIDRLIEISQRAEKMILNPISANIYLLDAPVNSEYDDYSPLITADESMLVFTSRRSETTGGVKDPYGEYLEDIYIGYNEDDQWVNIKNAGPPLNSNTHDAAVGLSPEGNMMITYRTNEELVAGDLYFSRNDDGKWSDLMKLGESINTRHQEASASLTQDERVIYFSSDRPGGYGGKDIYRVVKLGNKEWSLAMNLGPSVNSAYDEDAPFIHPDGKTLYFSSRGHKTMGGYDVFKSTLGDEYWSKPENIGYPVNSVGNDIFFVLAADGKRGYYSANKKDGMGKYDIYAISFENTLERLRIVKGNTQDKTGSPLAANIEIFDEDGESFGMYRSNATTGNYIIILPPDLNFNMIVSADQYEPIEEELFYKGGTNTKERIQNFTLDKTAEAVNE